MEINDLTSSWFPRAFVYILNPSSVCVIFVSDENKNMSMTEPSLFQVPFDKFRPCASRSKKTYLRHTTIITTILQTFHNLYAKSFLDVAWEIFD